MYRVIDVPALFNRLPDHNFNGQDLRLRLSISDSFMPENDGETLVDFDQGKARVIDSGESDASITLDVAEFSSMIVGSVRFKELYSYGLAEISDIEYLDVVDRLFRTESKPFCLTRF
jgi:predicted acetyltransferase